MNDLLEKHFAGATVRDLADETGASHGTIHNRIREAKREHVTEIAGKLMVARRNGEVLWLTIPGATTSDVHMALTYFDWLLRELEDVTFKCRVHFATKPDGIALGLEEYVS